MLQAPLPLVFEETAAAAGGSATLHTVGGPAFAGEDLSRAGQDAGAQLESEVLAPMQRWMDVHAKLQARWKDVEGARLEVDSRRRSVAALSADVDAQRGRLGGGRGGGAKAETRLQETLARLQRKEGKLSGEG